MRGTNARVALGVLAACVAVVPPVGTAAAAAETGDPKATASGLKDKVRKLRKRLKGLEQQFADLEALPPAGPAGGDLAGSYPNPLIDDNAIGPLDIQNPDRSVNLPIGGWANWTDNSPIEYQTLANDDAPDFTQANAIAYVIEWDAGPDLNDPNSDTDYAATTFTVPPDYASDGHFALRVSKEPPVSPVPERLRCAVAINGDPVPTEIPGGTTGFASRVTTTAANASYTLTPPGTYRAGDTVQPMCAVDDGAPDGDTFDDATYLHSIEFRYESIQ